MKIAKKLLAYLLAAILLLPSFPVQVFAAKSADLAYSKVLAGISFSLRLPNGATYADTYHWQKSIDGKVAYCVEPGIMKLKGSAYSGEEDDREAFIRASLADYWGREKKDQSTEQNFYVQLYTWEMLGCTVTGLSDPDSKYNGMNLAAYNAWKKDIQPAIDAYFSPPSFDGQTVTVQLGDSITLTDSNSALDYYKLDTNTSDAKIAAKIAKKLEISATKTATDNGTMTFKYNLPTAYVTPAIYWETGDPETQDVMSIGVKVLNEFKLKIELEKLGNCKIVKTSEDGVTAGLKFRITGPGGFDKTVTIGSDGTALAEDLVAGTYTVTEVSTPGKYVQPQSQTVAVTAGATATVNFSNVLKKFRVALTKSDAQTTTVQGGASLAGAVYGLYKDGALQAQYTTDASGQFTTDYFVCGSGYTIQEIKPSTGYTLDPTVYQLEDAYPDGYTMELNTITRGVTETVIRGGVRVEKWDSESDTHTAQGDATLQGAVFEIHNRSTAAVLVSGTSCAPNTLVHTMTTGADGSAQTAADLLPYGTYEVIEKTPPNGYLATGVLNRTFKITENGAIVNLNASGTVIKNNVIRGGIRIEKWDSERNASSPQGDGTLQGAVFEIYNRSKSPVMVSGKLHAPNAVVHTLNTNASGVAETAANLLPYGSYEVIEKAPPTGYQAKGVLKQAFEITQNGVIVNLNTSATVIKNDVIRGGVRIEKWDNEIDEHRPQGGATLEGAVFELYNRSTNAVLVGGTLYNPGTLVHTMVTDADGVATTSADLLPYGTYEAIEVTPPKGYLPTGVLKRTFTIREQGVIVDLNTSETAIKNNPIRGDLEGVKISEDMQRMAGIPFKITSKTTGEAHTVVTDDNGYFSTASSWNPHSRDTNRGKTEFDGVWFGELDTLDDSLGALLYDTYVIEEQPCLANFLHELCPPFEVRVSRHMVTIDLGTVTNFYETPPEIGTTATDQASGTHSATSSTSTTIVDTVAYSGLKVGQEYALHGVLMDKTTGDPLLIDGKQVTAETTFTPEEPEGSVEVEFTFNNLGLQGKSVVVFETLYVEDTEVAVHADIDDEGQTVTFVQPEIGTTAIDRESGSHMAHVSKTTTIVDTVQYSGLTPGQEYLLGGIIMVRETDEPLHIDGAAVVASKTFIPEKEEGTIDLAFTFDSSALQGKSIVVFETLQVGTIEVAFHRDIEDEGQTVTFEQPEIGTTAIDQESDGHSATVGQSTTIVDTVYYSGLKEGQEYTVSGILMDKASGEPLLVWGQQVTANATFVAESADGAVELEFTFDSSALQGKVVVVFETLYLEDVEIATHADINDFEQSIAFETPYIGTTAKDKSTGAGHSYAGKSVTIVDTVQYTGLTPGEEYTLQGILMGKDTGESLLVNEKPVTSSATFMAEDVDGSVELSFTFDARGLAGKNIVVFEKLFSGETEIAVHEDFEDHGQTIEFKNPSIGTKARDAASGINKAEVSDKTTIIDKVSYTGLVPGDKYTIEGILMLRSTNMPLIVDGTQVTARTTFTPKKPDGSVELKFTFDSKTQEGRSVVVFEKLFYGKTEIAAHEDIKDEKQMVTFNEKPETPETITTHVPQTGDSNILVIALVVLCISAATSIVLLMMYRQKREDEPDAAQDE